MNRMLDGRVALITGGGRGIGRAAALTFAAAGARVAIATRSESPGAEVVDAITAAGGAANLFVTDLSNRSAIEGLINQVVNAFDGIDVIVHNAAFLPRQIFGAITDDALDSCFDLNLKVAFWLAEVALPHLEKSKVARLLCVSSITGNGVTNSGFAAYGASKAGLSGFIRQAGAELAAKGIRVNGVAPGVTMTEQAIKRMAAMKLDLSAYVPLQSATLPEDIAAALLFLASDAGRQITGQTIVVDGGQSLGFMG